MGSYSTPGCEGAPIWKIGYRLYWRNARAMMRPASEAGEAFESAKEFVDKVGEFSACGVRVSVDVFDEGDAVFSDTESGEDWEQMDSGVFAEQRFDSVFYRAPSDTAAYDGITNFRDAYFPISAEGVGIDPFWGLLMHEWLHGVVSFYSEIRQGWPVNDVHGGCDRPDYIARDPYYGCMVLPSWFADLMSGRVSENGVTKGILPDEWAYFGTPLHPLHVPVPQEKLGIRHPSLRLRSAGRRRGRVRLRLIFSSVLSGRTARVSLIKQDRTCIRRLRAGRLFRACSWHRAGRRQTRMLTLRPGQVILVKDPQAHRRLIVSVRTQSFEDEQGRVAAANAGVRIGN